MIIIKTRADLEKVRSVNHQHFDNLVELIGDRLNRQGKGYDPDVSGYTVYFEEGDAICGDIHEIGFTKEQNGIYHSESKTSPGWEVVRTPFEQGLFSVYVVYNNENCMEFFVPWAPWLDEELFQSLLSSTD